MCLQIVDKMIIIICNICWKYDLNLIALLVCFVYYAQKCSIKQIMLTLEHVDCREFHKADLW